MEPERLCALMHTALDNLITALETAPDTAMRQIGVLPEAERHQVLYDWNATQADYPRTAASMNCSRRKCATRPMRRRWCSRTGS